MEEFFKDSNVKTVTLGKYSNVSGEDAWLRAEREYFVATCTLKTEVPEKKLNKFLEDYNKFIQKALLGDSPFVAEDLQLTILNSIIERGKLDRESKN